MKRNGIRAMLARAVVALVGAGALAFAGTAPANAATLSASVSCESGGGQVFCFLSISGGTAPYSAVWTKGSRVFSLSTLSAKTSCTIGQQYSIQVVVRDSAGHSVTTGSAGLCRKVFQ